MGLHNLLQILMMFFVASGLPEELQEEGFRQRQARAIWLWDFPGLGFPVAAAPGICLLFAMCVS